MRSRSHGPAARRARSRDGQRGRRPVVIHLGGTMQPNEVLAAFNGSAFTPSLLRTTMDPADAPRSPGQVGRGRTDPGQGSWERLPHSHRRLSDTKEAPCLPPHPLRGARAAGAGWPSASSPAAQFMVIMDTSIIGVALPKMQADLGFTAQGLSWVFNAYVVAFGGLLLLGGRLSDLLRRPAHLLHRLGRPRRRLPRRGPGQTASRSSSPAAPSRAPAPHSSRPPR